MNLTLTILLLFLCFVCPALVGNEVNTFQQELKIEGPVSVNSNEDSIFMCSLALESQDNETTLEWRIDGEKYEGSQEILSENDGKIVITNAVSVTFSNSKEMVNIICMVAGSGMEKHTQKIIKIKGKIAF